MRPGQDQLLSAVAEHGRREGTLLDDAATGSGKTVATNNQLIAHSREKDNRNLYLVRKK